MNIKCEGIWMSEDSLCNLCSKCARYDEFYNAPVSDKFIISEDRNQTTCKDFKPIFINKGMPFEPPFRRRGKNIKDKNLRTICSVKASGTLRYFKVPDIENNEKLIADYICNLLNKDCL